MKKINGIRAITAITAICAAAFMLGACGNEESRDSTGKEEENSSEAPASDFEYIEKDGKIILTYYMGTSQDIILPAQVEGKDVIGIGYNCFSDVKRVVCPNTLEFIDSEAFAHCRELEELSLNEGLQKIGNNAFMYCSSLKYVSIPSTVVFIDELGFAGAGVKEPEILCGSAESWGAGIFSECCMTEVTIPAALKIVPEAMFERCESLETVVIEAGIERIDRRAFGYCDKLKSVNIPASVTEIHPMAFEYSNQDVVLTVEQGSYAETYAKQNKMAYEYFPAASNREQSGGNVSNDNAQGLKTKEDSNMKEGITERIQEVEKYCRVKFPDSYVIFIEEYNCGLPVANTFQTKDKDYVIRQFLGFVKDFEDSPLGKYDIAVAMAPIETYMTDNPDLVGCELIPIAVLTTDDYVCLDFKDNKEEPAVCIWSLVESEEFKPVTYHVADSFQEFVESLE